MESASVVALPVQGGRIEGVCLAALSLLFLGCGFVSLRGDSATFDETAHLPAGYSYLQRADFRLNPEHPPLSKAWAALPVWLLGVDSPDYTGRGWIGRDDGNGGRTGADQWLFGFDWMNGPRRQADRRDPSRLLVPARTAMLAAGWMLAAIAWAWSRGLWGPGGGLLTAALCATSPTLLAHSRLVTTDLPAALAFVAVAFAFWRYLRRPGAARIVPLAVAVPVALLVKFTTLLLGPILVILGLAWLSIDRPAARLRLRALLWAALVVIPVAWAGIWAGYGFRFRAAAEPDYRLDWSVVGLAEGAGRRAIDELVERRLLPEAYLYGLAYFLGGAERRVAYLNGDIRLTGWWYYFPEAFLLKTPPAVLLLTAGLLVRGIRRRRAPPDALFLAVPAAAYLAVTLAGNLNIGHRHLTPLYPLLFVALGALARPLTRRRHGRSILVALLVIQGSSFALAAPGFLGYFNVLAGGSTGGPRYLLDSNVDWGQDLARLARWAKREGVERPHLAYFGTADPLAYGLEFRKVLLVHDYRPRMPTSRPGPGDWLAISVNLLHGLYYDADVEAARELSRRRWLPAERISRWVELRDSRSLRGQPYPSLLDWAVADGSLSVSRRRQVEATLLTPWLRRLREDMSPAARIGTSILVYRMPGVSG